jgi:hypothetical protein
MFPGDGDWRCAKIILCKNPRHRCAAIQNDDQQILAPRFPDIGFRYAQSDAFYGQELFG